MAGTWTVARAGASLNEFSTAIRRSLSSVRSRGYPPGHTEISGSDCDFGFVLISSYVKYEVLHQVDIGIRVVLVVQLRVKAFTPLGVFGPANAQRPGGDHELRSPPGGKAARYRLGRSPGERPRTRTNAMGCRRWRLFAGALSDAVGR